MQLNQCKVLNDEEISKIHEASLKILSEVGIVIYSKEVLELLNNAGATVDFKKSIAKIPENLVEEILASVPSKVLMWNREKKPIFTLGEERSYIVNGFDVVFVPILGQNKWRKIAKSDVVDFAKIADFLKNIDIVAPQGMPQDVLPEASLIHSAEVLFNNSEKPFWFAPDTREVAKAIFDIARVVVGEDDLSLHPMMIYQVSPTSPLSWVKGAVEVLVETAKSKIPCNILPCPYAGVTTPLTLAGELTIGNTEFLSGAVISQLVRKGAPIIYGGGWNHFNMREGNSLFATPETAILRVAGIQLAKFYGVLSDSIGFDADSLCLDAQSAWETCLTGLSPLSAGADIVMDLGVYGTALISSNEKLVIDNEILEVLYRFIKGIQVSSETIAVDVIKKVGPKGNFLEEEHTLQHLRSGEYWEAEISNRCIYQTWLKRGSPDIVENARKKVREILRVHQPEELDMSVQKEIKRIIKTFESQIQKKKL